MAKTWKVEGLYVERTSPTDTEVIAWWKFNCGSTTKEFHLWWEWWSDVQKAWILGSDTAVSVSIAHYENNWYMAEWNPPSDAHATHVRICVNPIPTDGAGWKHGWAYSKKIPNPSWEDAYGEALEAPDIEAERNDWGQIRLSWEEPPALAEYIVFYQSVNDGNFKKLKTFPSVRANLPGNVVTGRQWTFVPADGATYRWEARWCLADGKTTGLPCQPTDEFEGRPLAPTDMTARAVSGTSIRLDWYDHGSAGDKWRIEYATDPDVWDNHSDDKTTVDVDNIAPESDGHNWYTVSSLETGESYWFRIVRVSEDAGDSEWGTSGKAAQISCVAGSDPEPPTLGIVPSCAPIDEPLRLSWTHNSTDGSSQTHYAVEVTVNGTTTTLTGGGTSSVTIDPTDYHVNDGDSIQWRVRTQGATEQWASGGGWSNTGTVIVWAKPASTIGVDSAISAYPLELSLTVGATATANVPTKMWLSVVCASSHTELMPDGTERWIAAGESVWSGEAVPGDTGCTIFGWEVSLGAEVIHLQGGEVYDVTGGCMTAQGMTSNAEVATFECDVATTDISGCDCEAELDGQTLSATIWPTCMDGPDGILRSDVVLSVWRVTPDGVEEIASNLPNDGTAICIDRHPSFGSCNYRIVATNVEDGGQGASDVTFNWKGPGIVLQWDEDWSEPSNDSEGVSFSGSRLVLPYNVDISEQWDKESSLNMWAGNRHPVSRYGTQVGHTATWSCVINKYANDGLLDDIRSLAAHMGDVHVREPFGSSYMALVQVSLSETHGEAAIPVTFNVTRVEG